MLRILDWSVEEGDENLFWLGNLWLLHYDQIQLPPTFDVYWDDGLEIFLCGFVAKLFPMNIRNSRKFSEVLEHKLLFSFIIIVLVVVLICYMSTDRFNSLINIFFILKRFCAINIGVKKLWYTILFRNLIWKHNYQFYIYEYFSMLHKIIF